MLYIRTTVLKEKSSIYNQIRPLMADHERYVSVPRTYHKKKERGLNSNGEKAGYKLWDILTDWLKLLIKSVVPDGISCCCCSAPGSVEATVILLGEDVYKYALPSLFLFHFVTKLSPSITILQLTNCRWKGGGEGKHCGRGTLQEHWLCRLTQRRHTRTMKLNRNSPGMTIHTHTHIHKD